MITRTTSSTLKTDTNRLTKATITKIAASIIGAPSTKFPIPAAARQILATLAPKSRRHAPAIPPAARQYRTSQPCQSHLSYQHPSFLHPPQLLEAVFSYLA